MATKKAKKTVERFIVLDTDECCFINDGGDLSSDTDGLVFREAEAIDIAKAWVESVGLDDEGESQGVSTVYKLVPVAKVRRVQAVVEKL